MFSVVFRPRTNKYARAIRAEPEQSLFYLVSIDRTGVRGQALIAVPQAEDKGLITFDSKLIEGFFDSPPPQKIIENILKLVEQGAETSAMKAIASFIVPNAEEKDRRKRLLSIDPICYTKMLEE